MTTLSDYDLFMLHEDVLQERYDDYWGDPVTDLPETDQIKVEIENYYPEHGDTFTTIEVASVTVPEGPADDLDEWALDQLYPLTGTGRTKGDSFYTVTVLKFDARPDLVGREFEYGY